MPISQLDPKVRHLVIACRTAKDDYSQREIEAQVRHQQCGGGIRILRKKVGDA